MQIYMVLWIDCEIGEIECVFFGFGGLVWLMLLFDGCYFVFVCCVCFQSMFFLYDFESGEECFFYVEFDCDMQEIWVIYGVYLYMLWMLDSCFFVFWVGGKLYCIEIVLGEVSEILFCVQQMYWFQEVLCFVVDVLLDEFLIKVICDVWILLQGDCVVFCVVGKFWV